MEFNAMQQYANAFLPIQLDRSFALTVAIDITHPRKDFLRISSNSNRNNSNT